MPRQTEPNANNALGDLLRSMMPRRQVRSENTQTFPNHLGHLRDVARCPVRLDSGYGGRKVTVGGGALDGCISPECRYAVT